jgi:N-acetylglucosaminyldiphosphoundecaprenol N-acetyl-beta-D-mannosaminyltransferase
MNASRDILVSVVIPTILRNVDQLNRAVSSALAQTHPPAEVVIVVDDDEAELPNFDSPTVRVVRNPGPHHGAAAARNVGTRSASGQWIAWLDDDDYWREDKLRRQLEILAQSGQDEAIVASRARLVTNHGWQEAPEALPGDGELVDYLFGAPGVRRSVSRAVYTPTLLIPRAVLERVPLNEAHPNWEDYEWLLRVTDAGVTLLWAPEPLAVCDQRRTAGPSLSELTDADRLASWSAEVLSHRSRRAYHAYRLTYVVPSLARASRKREALSLIAASVRERCATGPMLAKALLPILVPESSVAVIKRQRHVRWGYDLVPGRPPTPSGRVDICGVDVDILDSAGTLAAFTAMLDEPRPHHHAGVNAAKVVDCGKDHRFARVIAEADIVNPDGISVVWASRILGNPLPERVTGVDIMGGMLRIAQEKGWKTYFLGARPDVVERAVTNLKQEFPRLNVAGYRSGYWDRTREGERLVVEEIRRSGADILFVGIPSPAKEFFYDDHASELGVRMVVGVGGTFDVVAGEVKRAPRVAQRLGLEWFYRLIQEPRRLWRRYLLGNAEFIGLVLKYRIMRRVRKPASPRNECASAIQGRGQ